MEALFSILESLLNAGTGDSYSIVRLSLLGLYSAALLGTNLFSSGLLNLESNLESFYLSIDPRWLAPYELFIAWFSYFISSL